MLDKLGRESDCDLSFLFASSLPSSPYLFLYSACYSYLNCHLFLIRGLSIPFSLPEFQFLVASFYFRSFLWPNIHIPFCPYIWVASLFWFLSESHNSAFPFLFYIYVLLVRVFPEIVGLYGISKQFSVSTLYLWHPCHRVPSRQKRNHTSRRCKLVVVYFLTSNVRGLV